MELWIAEIKSTSERPIQKLISPLIFNGESNCYIASEYEGTIVVKTSNNKVQKVFLSHYGVTSREQRIPLIYDEQWDVWYDKGDELEERSPIGINQCGTFFFEAEDGDGYIIDRSSDVYITSSLLTEEEFQQMKDEIVHMLEDLLTANEGPATPMRLWRENVEAAQYALEQTKKLHEVLLELEDAPHEQLIREQQLVPSSKIKRFNAEFLINRKLFPFKDKFSIPVNVRSIDILEHRMIRWGLERLIDYADRYLRQARNRKRDLCQRRDFLIYALSSEKDQRLGIWEQKRINNSIKKDLVHVSEFLRLVCESERYWEEIVDIAKKCLNLHYLNVGEEELAQTHLFTFSPLYSEAYQYLDDLLNLKPLKQLSNTYAPLQKSPKLYEVWCLLSIIHSLIYECGFIPVQNPYTQIQRRLQRKRGLEGISFTFHRPVYRYENSYELQEMDLTLEVYYERPFLDAEKSYRPDFTFIFRDSFRTETAFLDAKYKPLPNREYWAEIVRDVSFEKYYEPLPKKPIASFLMHPNKLKDVSIHTWNAAINHRKQEELRHRLGSFDYKPSNKKGFVKWMNMLLHYHLGYNGVCMHCGAHFPAKCEYDVQQKKKKYFTCSNPECEAFWVESFCFNRKGRIYAKKDAHESSTATLFKYTKHSGMNYHKETPDEWDVFCPVCNKRAQDRFTRVRQF
ncbi:hypothetical protein BRO54_2127 [Geobacillus proteiniphilus]|uniref:DUF2357 domain-containing protein n=1 Tax=Geobacillus proteiniphilus TaxID=860353 RepID=A0A1Q5SYJ5_9BACL|nr:hypothetical protein [Geobacillus proteiniphilus]OKO93064.1 hypothetical protein BRO54_2127 [Geobacillus proteiniphilus]